MSVNWKARRERAQQQIAKRIKQGLAQLQNQDRIDAKNLVRSSRCECGCAKLSHVHVHASPGRGCTRCECKNYKQAAPDAFTLCTNCTHEKIHHQWTNQSCGVISCGCEAFEEEDPL